MRCFFAGHEVQSRRLAESALFCKNWEKCLKLQWNLGLHLIGPVRSWLHIVFISSTQWSHWEGHDLWLTPASSPQCVVWVEGATEAGLPPHPDHALRSSRQHQRQLLSAHLRHLPPGAREPAARRPGRHRHLHHHPEQGGVTAAHLL